MRALIEPVRGAVRNHIRRLWTSTLARNAWWMLAGQGLNLVFQAGYFVLLARLLGVKEYGIFVGAFAFVAIATPYCALGSGLVFVRHVSANPKDFAAYWGNILLSTVGVGFLLTLLLCVLAPHVVNPASASLVLLLALSECICRQLVICTCQIFQAFEQLRLTVAMILLTSFLRLMAVLVLAAFLHHATARIWVLSSLLVSVIAAVSAAIIVTERFGAPSLSPKLLLSRAGEGFGFALSGSSQSAYNDIDKAMLSHYGMNVENGIYTMAYRLVDLATIPAQSLDAAALPRFCRQGQDRPAAVVSLSFKLASRSALLGLAIAACLYVAAPIIPHVVGDGFKNSVMALRWLCLLPVFRSIHQLTGSAITGLGFQRYRTTVQCLAATLNFGLNLWLIPRYGWRGAAWASLATDGLLGLASWGLLQYLDKTRAARERSAGFAEDSMAYPPA